MKIKTHNRAFTLLEMLLVIAIIAILAGIVIVAINPGRQLAQARNSQRWNDVRSLHAAVQQYYIDNKEWPAGLDQTETDGTMLEVCREGQSDSSCLDLESSLVPTYLSAIPEDPQVTATSTLYRIGINPTSQTPNVLAVNSTEYELEQVEITTPCGDPSDDRCWETNRYIIRTWGPTSLLTSAQSITDGKTNTQILVDREENFAAAKYCYDLEEGGYSDWYLPAINQLEDGLYDQLMSGEVNTGFSINASYLSSTDHSSNNVWNARYTSSTVNKQYTVKNWTSYRVRCIR